MCNKQTKLFRRSVDEKTANEEFEVTVNGPNLANCDGVVMEALDNYWRKKSRGSWHFFRTSVLEQLRPTKESVVLTRLLKTKNTLPFMD